MTTACHHDSATAMLPDRLREHTRARHEELERVLALPQDESAYIAQLAAYHGFIAPWERRIATVIPPEDPIRAGREKTAWLEDDLRSWGVDPALVTPCPVLPPCHTRAEILGGAYVLEASTLGGQVILRHLVATFGPRERGFSYFRSYGTEVGSRWLAFRAELVRASSAEADPVILASADRAFACLHAWFAAQSAVHA